MSAAANGRSARWRVLLAILFAPAIGATPLADCYRLEEIALPAGVPPEVGAMTFDPEGTLYAVLRRGDVIATKPSADAKAFSWRLVATGFDNPGGIVVPAPGRILVSQFAEITEATDTDGDGRADRYRSLANDWGLSGNYQEHTSLCSDGAGGAYLALATGSFAGPTFLYTRGEFSASGRRGRNFSAVKYRGWGAPSEGLQRLQWRGGTPFTIENIHITPAGFRVVFTSRPGRAAQDVRSYVMRSMTYQPRWTYGSAPEDVRAEAVAEVTSVDDRTVHLALARLQPGRVYHLRLTGELRGDNGEPPAYRDFWYTANRVPKAR